MKTKKKSSVGSGVDEMAYLCESAVLSCMILDAHAKNWLIKKLKPDHFHSKHNQAVFKAIASLHSGKVPVDIVAIKEKLIDDGGFSNTDCITHLVGLIYSVDSTCDFKKYFAVVDAARSLRNAQEKKQ